MAKEIDLLRYWMPILRNIKEFKEIAKTEEPELRYILEAIDRTLANMFIETADEYGIKRFEDMMGLYPNKGDSLETRRFNVLIKWNDKVPYTDKELYNRLLSLCGGADKFEITEKYKEYLIEIVTHLGVNGAFDAVTNLLEEMLPCNIVLDLKNILEAKKDTPLNSCVAISTAMSYQITHDIKEDYKADAPLIAVVGLSRAGTHIITNDISSKVAKETPLNEAVAVSKAVSEIITHDVGIQDSLQAPVNSAVGVGIAHTTIITHDLNNSANIKGNYTAGTPVSTATVVTIKS